MIFYYSGCGNSRFIATQLAEMLEEQTLFIPDLQRQGFKEYEFSEGEALGFVFPVYSWAAPKFVDDFVLETLWKGKPSYVWFACTCGDEMGQTHKLFRDVLAKAGLKLEGTFCFQMPETYLAMPGFHLDSKEGEEKKIADAKEKLPRVAEMIRQKTTVVDEIVGSMPWLKSNLIRKGFNRSMSDKGYRVTDACTGCGLCMKKCPFQNISMSDGHPVWNGHCTECMACYHHCPVNAIQYASYTKGKGQYHFPE